MNKLLKIMATFSVFFIASISVFAAEFEDSISSKPEKASAKSANKSRPNMIVILADDMGVTDVGAFHEIYPGSNKAQLAHKYTPTLDRLARQGVRCTRAYAASWCAPSRQMLLSGQWVNRRKAYDHPWIGNQLRQAGYVTGLVGKSHGSRPIAKSYGDRDPKTAEFDDGFFFNGGSRRSYLEKGERFPGRRGLVPFTFKAKGGEYLTDVYTDHAVEFIENHADQPFMLYLPYNAPHAPLNGKPEDLRKLFPDTFAGASDKEIMSGRLSAPRPKKGKTSTAMANKLAAMHFAAMVYRMDLGISRIMKTLKKEGIDDNTLIIFASDNGRTDGYGEWLAENHPFTGHKSDLLDGGIRTPFIVWSAELAKSKQSGKIYDGLVSLADIAPTLMAQATDKPYGYPTDGVDLMPYISGKKPTLKGRTWFCALSGSLLKMTVTEDFSVGKYKGNIVHLAYVQDDQKILCWIPQDGTKTGATYASFPNVVGMTNPSVPLREQTPVSGIVPEKGSGKELYKQMTDLIYSSGTDLVPVWSGGMKIPPRESWMIFAKDKQSK